MTLCDQMYQMMLNALQKAIAKWIDQKIKHYKIILNILQHNSCFVKHTIRTGIFPNRLKFNK